MSDLSEDELHKMIDDAVRDNTERCALLCEMRADISRASAAKIRKDGSYTTRAIWPPFKRMTYVMPKWERQALLFDDVARAFNVVAGGIRAGWDPRKVAPHERSDEKITIVETGVDGDPTLRTIDETKPTFPCFGCSTPMDCASWQCCERGHGDWV